jgi:hypothetical protein
MSDQDRRPRGRWLARAAAAGLAAVLTALAGAASPAQAAVPDGHGFVLWNGAAVVPSGTWPPASTVTPLGAGLYRIVFPGQAARGGVVHVTAVNGGPAWCQAVRWGPSGADELAYVRCHRPGTNVGLDSPFTAIFASSSPPDGIPGHYGYVHAQANGTIVSEYNSTIGGGNIVTPTGVPGEWVVEFPKLGTPGPFDGSLQVTAVNVELGAHCEIARWASTPTSQFVAVFCFDAFGNKRDTAFNLTYQYERALFGPIGPPKFFGYLWNMSPPPVPNVGPVTTNFNSQFGLGVNTIISSGPGMSLVVFRGLAQRPDTVQVSPFGHSGEICNLQAPWGYSGTSVLVRNVACYTSAGVRTESGHFTTYNSES